MLRFVDTRVPLDFAEHSRPMRELKKLLQARRKSKVGRKIKREDRKSRYVNWTAPFLWERILQAGKRAEPQMCPVDIVKDLNKRRDPIHFRGLTMQNIGRWIDRSGPKPKWSAAVLKRAARGNCPGGMTTRVGILVGSFAYFHKPTNAQLGGLPGSHIQSH